MGCQIRFILEPLFHFALLFRVTKSDDEFICKFGKVPVCGSHDMHSRKEVRPRLTQALTVPSGAESRPAISPCV